MNEAKRQFILVGKKAEQSDYFTWNNAEIQAKIVVKYLGVLIDYQLDIREHVNFFEKQCAKFITILYQTRQFLDKNLLVKIFKQYAQPRYQYGILIYGTTTKSILTKLQRQQNFFLRIVFQLKKSDEVRTTRKKHAIASIFELHVYEVFKLLVSILRRTHPHESVNRFLEIVIEVEKSLNDTKRLKSLPTIHKLTKQNRKWLSVRVRLLYNVLAQFDETIIRKAIYCEQQKLNDFLHKVRDNYILDSEVFNNLF